VNSTGWTRWNYDGDHTGMGLDLNTSAQLRNFWSAYLGANLDGGAYSSGALRGGPLFRTESSTNVWGGLDSDSRKAVSVSLNGWGTVRPESHSWNLGIGPSLGLRPSGRASFRVGGSLSRNVDDRQWVDDFEGVRTDYVFARIDQTTVGLNLRADYAFTPTLSLQIYAEPFVSAGRYGDFKRVVSPVAARYADRFAPLTTREQDGVLYADVHGDGVEESFDRPDFDFKQFRSNAVLRWEYRPGSTLFVVWSQGRDDSVSDGAFDVRGDVRTLFDLQPQNVFMVKASYWLSR
jgi:Domain of unknown function (DUF5916)